MRLALDPNVVPNWSIWEALREIIQGAIDAESEYKVTYENKRLIIENNGMLSRASLLIGHSDKRDDSSKIGQHGEGYKLAAAILLRNNKKFRIYNNKEIWTFNYRRDRNFQSNVINVDIRKWFVGETGKITWEISDITEEEFTEFKTKTIIDGDIRGTNAWILLDRPGDIFSGGLFIQHKKDLEFGYNFDIGILSLQRDRDLISDFDIYWQTSQAWDNLPDAATHIRNNVPDVKYITNAGSNSYVRNNTVANLFYSEHGKKANPCVYETDKISGAKNIIVSNPEATAIKKSSYFIPIKEEPRDTPYDILFRWFYQDQDQDIFLDILKQSKQWYL